VMPGSAEGRGPQSMNTGLWKMDSGFAAARRPGMACVRLPSRQEAAEAGAALAAAEPLQHRPERCLVGRDDRLFDLALPFGDVGHRREIAAGHDKRLDLRLVDPSESLARIFRPELADRIGVGRGKAFERDNFKPVLALVIPF